VTGRRVRTLAALTVSCGLLVLAGCDSGGSGSDTDPSGATTGTARASTTAADSATPTTTRPLTSSMLATTGAPTPSRSSGSTPSASSEPTPSAAVVVRTGSGSVAIRIPGAGTQSFPTSATCVGARDFTGRSARGATLVVTGSTLTAHGFSGVNGDFVGTVTVSGDLRVFTGTQGVATAKAQARC
jgi:hypothetical protein